MLDLLVRYRKYSILGLVVVAAVALLTAQQTRPGEGLWLAEGIAAVTAPAQMAFARVHRGAASVWVSYLDWKHLRTEVARLRAETVALRLRQLRQEALEAENLRLRTLATLRERLPERTLGAEVVARDWNGFTRGLTIDRGRAGGAERLSAVIVTERGRRASRRASPPVGDRPGPDGSRIEHRRRRAADARPGSRGGRRGRAAPDQAGRERGGPPAGRSRGDLRDRRALSEGAAARPGPAGSTPPTGLFRTAELEPAVDLTSVEEVLVLPRGTGGDLAPAFPEG